MKGKSIHVLSIVLIMGCLCAGILGSVLLRPSFYPLSSFELQEKYAAQLENKLVNLLEPATGIGNVRASVQAEIRHQNTRQSSMNFKNGTRTTFHEKGPILVAQSVSVLINGKDKNKLSSYQNLVKGAVGFDVNRGDSLIVEMLPFAKVPLWTLGLTPLWLIRIAAVLLILITGGVFWLFYERKRSPKKIKKSYILDEHLWHQAELISPQQIAFFLQKISPEITATILHHFSSTKATEVVENFASPYKDWVSMHLDYVEKLKNQDFLLKKAEEELREILKNFPQDTLSTLNQFQSWSDKDIQNLLRYVSKNDFIRALQRMPFSVRQIFERNIPPTLWQEFIQKMQRMPCLESESLQAQEKMINLAELLKKAE